MFCRKRKSRRSGKKSGKNHAMQVRTQKKDLWKVNAIQENDEIHDHYQDYWPRKLGMDIHCYGI